MQRRAVRCWNSRASTRPVLWCLHSRDLFAPALARVGLHPDRIIFCETWKDREILPAMEEGLRHRGIAGVVGELSRLSLTPSRRLQLAAESSGAVGLIVRRSGGAVDENNAAHSRWRISSVPSPVEDRLEMGRARWLVNWFAAGGRAALLGLGGMRCAGLSRCSCRCGRLTAYGGRTLARLGVIDHWS